MIRVNPFRGLGVALITPFTINGEVDYPQLEKLIDNQIESGVDFICILGTTAETPCLSKKEKDEIMSVAKRVNNHRVPLLLGAGGNCTADVIDNLHSTNLDGIDGLLIVTPYYNKPSQKGLYLHFKTVADAFDLPIVLYNVPGRTGVNLSAQTTLRIAADCPNVVAIKEASGQIAQIDSIIAGAPQGFEVISGDDAITVELLSIGAVGVISVLGNAYPAEFGQMVRTAMQGDFVTSLAIHRKFSKAYHNLTVDGNPYGIKAMLSLQNKCNNVLRLPLVPVSKQTYEALEDVVSTLD